MGQAKRRGNLEERIAQSIDNAWRKATEAEIRRLEALQRDQAYLASLTPEQRQTEIDRRRKVRAAARTAAAITALLSGI